MKRCQSLTIVWARLLTLATLAAGLALVLPGAVQGQEHAHPSPAVSAVPGQVTCPAEGTSQTVLITIPPGAAGRGPDAFGANPRVISVGTTVIWKNDDSVNYELHTDDNLVDTGVLQPGQCYAFVFNTAGTFAYHDHIHGEEGASGVIQVQ